MLSKNWQFFLGVALAIVFLDHLTKYWIDSTMAIGTGFPVIPNIFDIVHVRNKGAAFGFMNGWDSPMRNLFFYALGMAALVFVVQFYRNTPQNDKASRLAFALIAGGAIGNLSDRYLRGSVVDFLSVHYYDAIWQPKIFGSSFTIPLSWPAFNVADSAITVAIVILLWRSFVRPYREIENTPPLGSGKSKSN